MEKWIEVRRKVLVEKVSKRQIHFRLSCQPGDTRKVPANPEPPGYRQLVARPKRKLGDYLWVICQHLSTNCYPFDLHTSAGNFSWGKSMMPAKRAAVSSSAIADYIENFYNIDPRHSSLEYFTLNEFEAPSSS